MQLRICQNRSPHRPAPPLRRGSLLILVMMTGMIVSVICLGALLVQNVNLSQTVSVQNSSSARWAARSGVAVASREIVESSTWRTTRTPGNWHSSVALNTGSWTLNATDPTDSSFSDNAAEPVLLSGTASFGTAVQKASGLHQVDTLLRQPCLFAACAGDIMTIENASVSGFGWLGSRGQLIGSGTNSVQFDVMTSSTISGLTPLYRSLTGATIDALPSFSDFAELVSLGTAVSAAAVPSATASTAQVIRNNDFERGDAGWLASPSGTLVEMSSGGALDSECIRVTNRNSTDCGIAYDVTGAVRNGFAMTFSASVLPASSATTFEVSLQVTTTAGTSTAASSTSGSVASGTNVLQFQTLSTTLTPAWSGRLIKALLKIRTSGTGSAGTQEFRVDNVNLTVTSAPSGKAIHRRVISTAANPFSVTSNSNGIYVLNMAGADLTISGSMIVGTLIVQNAGTVYVGSGPVQWRPAKPGLPALVVDGNITLTFSRFALNERELNVNLNPSGTPDELGSTDTSMNDFYLPEIRGLTFASGDVMIEGDVVLNGTVLAGDDLTLRQRVTINRMPNLQTVPRTSTHSMQSFIRESGSMTRSFD